MRESGFTLIELLIVVAIIGILAAIAVPNFLNAQMRARVARVEAEFRSIRTAFESYRLDNGNYPDWGNSIGWEKAWSRLTTPIAYMSFRPIDVFQPTFRADYVNEHNFYEFSPCKGTMSQGAVIVAHGIFDNFVLASLGPDKDDDTQSISDYPKTSLFIPYNMSNGLYTNGDVLYETSAGLNKVTGR